MTGEALGLATEIFMAAGALDVFTIPIQMKKNRPGILLTCLCEMEEREKFTGLFFLHTSTRGVRYQVFERAKLESTFETRKTSYGNIPVYRFSSSIVSIPGLTASSTLGHFSLYCSIKSSQSW